MKIAVAQLKTKQNKIKKSSGMDSSGFATHTSTPALYLLSLVHVVFIGAGMQAWRQAYNSSICKVFFFQVVLILLLILFLGIVSVPVGMFSD